MDRSGQGPGGGGMAGSGPPSFVERAGGLWERGPEGGEPQDEGGRSQVGEGMVNRKPGPTSQGIPCLEWARFLEALGLEQDSCYSASPKLALCSTDAP